LHLIGILVPLHLFSPLHISGFPLDRFWVPRRIGPLKAVKYEKHAPVIERIAANDKGWRIHTDE
jgi:hypothetical protein